MGQSAVVNTFVFLVCFASGFLLAGKRPILTLSTRALLVVVFSLALWYATSDDRPYHGILGAATSIANVLFIGFVAIDLARWRRNRIH